MGKVIHRGRDGQGATRKYYRKKDGSLALAIEIAPDVIEFGKLITVRDRTILDAFEDALRRSRAALRAGIEAGDTLMPSRSSRPLSTRRWRSCVKVWRRLARGPSHERRPRRALPRALARHSAQTGILSSAALAGRDQPCPACGGHDRFRFTDKGFGRWFCRGCGMGGDGLRLVQTIKRVDFQTAAALVETIVGKVDAPDARKNPDKGKSAKPSDPMKPWREAGAYVADSPVDRYFRARALIITESEAQSLRYAGSQFHWPSKSRWPARSPRSRSPTGSRSVAIRHSSARTGKAKRQSSGHALFAAGGKTTRRRRLVRQGRRAFRVRRRRRRRVPL